MGANAQTSVPAFTAGQVLTAAQVTGINTGIPVFASSTERDAAFGGTGEKTLAEGQMAYLEDRGHQRHPVLRRQLLGCYRRRQDCPDRVDPKDRHGLGIIGNCHDVHLKHQRPRSNHYADKQLKHDSRNG